MELAYYPGCTLKSSSHLLEVQSIKVLAALDVHLRELEDWSCCGATSAGKTDDFMALAMPARNLGIACQSSQSELVIPCSACYSRTLVAQKRLQDDPAIKEEINSELEKKVDGDVKVSTLLEVLLPKVRSGEIAEKVKRPLAGLNPACYYGCMLTRFPCDVPVSDDVENPRGMEEVIQALGVKKPLDWSYKTDCCGASAAMNDQETAFLLMSRIMRDAVDRGANCFVTTCPMCQMNLDAYQDLFCDKHGICERLPVYFITELLGVAMGMSAKDLQIDRHIVDATSLLKELNLV